MAETDPPEGDLEDRVERLEGGIGRIQRMLEQVIGTDTKAHEVAEEHQEERLGRPSDMKQMIQMELEAKERKAAEAAAKQAEADEQKSVKEDVAAMKAKMMEAKPVTPIRRITKVVWNPPR